VLGVKRLFLTTRNSVPRGRHGSG